MTARSAQAPAPALWRRPAAALARPLRFVVAVALTQTIPGALLVVGYAQERMRRHSEAVLPPGRARFTSPPWLFRAAQTHRLPITQYLKEGLTSVASGLACYLPAGSLLALGWFTGWNQSFHKGVEYAPVGPLLTIAGLLAGMLALSYVPLAQARAAYCRRWDAFFAFRTNITLLRASPLLVLALAVIGGVLMLVWVFVRVLPVFAPQIPPLAEAALAPSAFLQRWFVLAGCPFIALYFLFKRTAARGYARALQRAARSGWLPAPAFYPIERRAVPSPTGGETRPPRATWLLLALGVIAWLPSLALVIIAQFFNNTGYGAWINHPLAVIPLPGY